MEIALWRDQKIQNEIHLFENSGCIGIDAYTFYRTLSINNLIIVLKSFNKYRTHNI